MLNETYGGPKPVVPQGPLALEKNMEARINCTISKGGYNYWAILYESKEPVVGNVNKIAPGIFVTNYGNNMSSLIIITTDTSIVAIVC